MTQTLTLVCAGTVGALLGVIFFGGLWWTVRRGVSSTRPARLFLGSLAARTGLTLTGFYLVSDGRWERLLACLLGFMAARFIVRGLVSGAPAELHDSPAKPGCHAP